MSLFEALVLDAERARSTALAMQVEVTQLCEWTEDLMRENVHWHREALAIMRQTHALTRERARLVRRVGAEPPDHRSE